MLSEGVACPYATENRLLEGVACLGVEPAIVSKVFLCSKPFSIILLRQRVLVRNLSIVLLAGDIARRLLRSVLASDGASTSAWLLLARSTLCVEKHQHFAHLMDFIFNLTSVVRKRFLTSQGDLYGI